MKNQKQADAEFLEALTGHYSGVYMWNGKPRRVDGERITAKQAKTLIAALVRHIEKGCPESEGKAGK